MKKVLSLLIIFLSFFIFDTSAQVKSKQISRLDHRIDTLLNAMTVSEKLEQLYNNGFMTTPSNTRLNIPGFVMDDGPHGVRLNIATAFPTGIAMASTWDKAMLKNIGKAMGEEFWAFGKNQQLGPCIDLTRDPRAGRSAESGSEDPFLSGQIGAAVIKGIQSTPVIATVKHFMVESKQAYRNSCNELFTERWLMEHYGYNFRTSVQEGASMSIMSSYNLINGEQATQNVLLLHKALRERWGFPFYVVSDWGAVHNSSASVIAGNDVCMGSDNYRNDLPSLVSSNQLPIAYIDTAVRNVLRTKILAGMLDYYPKGDAAMINSTAHVNVARNGARKSLILLKNKDNILPLKSSNITKIAIIGPNATKGNLNCFGSSETTPPYSVSVLQGIATKIASTKISSAYGCDINSNSVDNYQKAKDAASKADVVVFVGGLDDTQEGEAYSYGNDRTNGLPDLPGQQQDLINQLSAINPNIIVVIQSGGVCSLHGCINNIKGLLYSFYGGMEAGTAIADVLFGDYNPAGRMPVTMPTGIDQLPEWDDDFTNDFGCGYRWFDQKNFTPEFAFGFGLSYTQFEYSNMQISATSLESGSPVTISIDIKNTGNIAGDEVAQLYITNHTTTIWMPKKELKGFERINLAVNETKTVTFTLTAEDFYYWNEAVAQYEVFAGSYSLGLGGSSDLLPITGNFELTSATPKADLKITQIFTMPRYPLKGEKVSFYALVKNQGTAAVLPEENFDLSFNIDGVNVANAKKRSVTLAPGQAMMIASNDTVWQSSVTGNHLLSAEVDVNQTIQEWIKTNNTFSRTIEVFTSQANTNLALKKPIYVSSTENNNIAYAGSQLVDESIATRWSSAFADPQTIVVDLQKSSNISQINLYWEDAYATSYEIAVSADSVAWSTEVNTSTGKGGIESYPLTVTGKRYVRLICKTRATVYGYSLFEIEVINADAAVSNPPVAVAGTTQTIILPINTVTLDGSASKNPNSKPLTFAWEQLNGPETATLTDAKKATATASNLVIGSYIFKLSVSNGTDTTSDILTIQVLPEAVISPTGIKNEKINNIKIYPNPTSDVLFINMPDNTYTQLSIFDITGQKILTQSITATTQKITVSSFKPGLYFIRLTGKKEIISRKFEIR